MYKTAVVCLALALVMPATGFAAPAESNGQPDQPSRLLTLREAIARVQAVGFDIRAARGDAETARADAGTARSATQPQIGISAVGLVANEPQLGMPIAQQLYGQALLTVPVFAPATWAAARAAAKNAAAAATAVDATVNDAVFAAVQAYRRAQLGDAVLAARGSAVQAQRDHLRLSEVRVATGKAPRYILARDRAMLAVALQAQEDAAAERDEAHNDLAALLDLNGNLAVEPLATTSFDETLATLTPRALKQRPSLIAAERQVEAAQASLTAARAAYLPNASLTAQSYNGVSSPDLGRAGGQIQLAATLPILDGGNRAAAIERARGGLDHATAMRDQMRRGVARDVADAFRELQAAQRNLATAQAAQADADEQYRVALLRESARKAIELEVLDALAVAANAHEGVLRALARYDDAVAAVHHAAGDPNV